MDFKTTAFALIKSAYESVPTAKYFDFAVFLEIGQGRITYIINNRDYAFSDKTLKSLLIKTGHVYQNGHWTRTRNLFKEYMDTIRHIELTPSDLRDRRKALGLSQEKFSELLDVSTDTIQRWEYGKRRIPARYAEKIQTLSRG